MVPPRRIPIPAADQQVWPRGLEQNVPFWLACFAKETLLTLEIKPAVHGALEEIRVSNPKAHFLSVWLK